MRILHIWDQAGVACILAKYQRELGHHVKVLKRANYDPFRIFKFYNEPLLDIDGKSFINLALKEAKDFDIIHIHSIAKLVPMLKKKYHNKKIIVLHYHGSEIRNSKNFDNLHANSQDQADIILVSTLDLLNHVKNSKCIYLPNPIDIQHFSKLNNRIKSIYEEKALTITTNRTNIPILFNYLLKNNIKLKVDVIDRVLNSISYSELPNLLFQYTHYIDIKYDNGTILPALSKTGLEALACGIKVLTYDLRHINEFPSEHKPENVVKKLLTIIQ